jgi:phosphoribosylanthranilate isomerase
VTWIKICGTTSERDADIAIRAGANALGFVMAESPRQVTDTTAYSIGTIVPKGVETIGVFVNEKLDVIIQTARFCRFTGVQLHGDEDRNYVAKLRGALPGVKIIKTISLAALPTTTEIVPDLWLLDSGTSVRRGGTGKTFDWQAAQSLLRRLTQPVIVAGGLNPDNVHRALEMLQPWGIDVVSGVESYPGRKHPGAVTQFIDAVRQFDAVNRSKLNAHRGRYQNHLQ